MHVIVVRLVSCGRRTAETCEKLSKYLPGAEKNRKFQTDEKYNGQKKKMYKITVERRVIIFNGRFYYYIPSWSTVCVRRSVLPYKNNGRR